MKKRRSHRGFLAAARPDDIAAMVVDNDGHVLANAV